MTLTASAESILERAERDVEDGLVPAEIFNDRGIYELELERIFTRCWVFVGHESELPNPGDYRLRRIGEDSFIFLRGSDGVIRVLLNSCRHRGSTICRLEVGNTATFRCPYHAWTYDNRGELVGVPSRTTAYQQLDLSEWGLVPAPKVDRYQGLVFACLDPDGPELEAYLGRFRWYLDMQLALTDGGMEVLGEPHRWQVPADWKSGAENFTGDSSHTQMTHRSILTLGLADEATAGRVGGANGVHVNDLDGHAISLRLLSLTGVQLGVAAGIVGTVAAESKVGKEGIGHMVIDYYSRLELPEMYVLVLLVFICASVLAIGMNRVVRGLRKAEERQSNQPLLL